MLKIESNKLTVCIDELGAQMSSIYLKEDGTEFLWQKESVSYFLCLHPAPVPESVYSDILLCPPHNSVQVLMLE